LNWIISYCIRRWKVDEMRKGGVSSIQRVLSVVTEFFAKALHPGKIFPSVLVFLECCFESCWFLAEYMVLTVLVSIFVESAFPDDVVSDARNQVQHIFLNRL
jgi:hypothetical protein